MADWYKHEQVQVAVSVILPKNSVFLHVPKTGGVWVRETLKELNLHAQEIRSRTKGESTERTANSWHTVPIWSRDYRSRKHKFCFVRNPLTWHQSYWAFRMTRKNWSKTSEIDTKCRSDNFQIYINNVLAMYPEGYVSWLYEFYTPHCDFVGRYESLAHDLTVALTEFGEIIPFWSNDTGNVFHPRIEGRKNKRSNDSLASEKAKAIYTDEQIDRIIDQEREIFDRYGYERFKTMSYMP